MAIPASRSKARVTWRGPQIVSQVEAAAARAMREAGTQIVRQIRSDLSSPYPPASRPFTPPHKRSGQLRRDQKFRIVRSANGLELQVGVRPGAKSYRYARHLAKGTSRMKRREWLDETRVALVAAAKVQESIRREMR